MQLIYTAEYLQVLWPCAPWLPHSEKWRGTCPSWIHGAGAYGSHGLRQFYVRKNW